MSGINSSNGPKAKPQAKLGATSSAAAFGGANANILSEVFATNLAGIGALNDATKSQEDLLTYYNDKTKKLSAEMKGKKGDALTKLQTELGQLNTESQSVGQRASNLTNAINTLTQQMSALTTAEASAISFPQ